MRYFYGPSDRVRTCGLMVPNHPRYQLRYTRIFDFCFLEISPSVVIPVVKGDFAASFRQREKPANRGAARLSGIGAGRGPDTGAALPNQARYQLRYTRTSDFSILAQTPRKAKCFAGCGQRRLRGGEKSPQTAAL